MLDSSKKHHLVVGAAGAQGGAIARELLTRGESVRGLVRSSNSNVPDGVEKAIADLDDSKALFSAFIGITHATITIPLVYDAATVARYAQNLADAAVAAGVERLVFNANTRINPTATDVAGMETRRTAEHILRASGIPTVSLQPAVYLENLLAPGSLAAIEGQGALYYPLPAETAVSWISLGDLARSVYVAHQIADAPASPVAIGTAALTGPQLAAQLSQALGRPLSYRALDPALFEQSIAPFLGNEAAAGVAGLYHWAFQNPQSLLLKAGATEMREQFALIAQSPKEWANHQPRFAALKESPLENAIH